MTSDFDVQCRIELLGPFRLIQSGRIPRDESIVVSITGNGLKTQEAVVNELVQPRVIEAKLNEFDALLVENQTKAKAPPAPALASV